MKKPAGIVIIAGLLLLLGLRLLAASPASAAHTTRVVLGFITIVLGVISVVTAYLLWKLRPRAVLWYGGWAGAWLLGGALVQALAAEEPLPNIVIWWVFVGATLAGVGLYLRSALQRTV